MSVSDFVSDVSINGGLTVASDTSLNGSLFVASDTSLNGKLFVGDGGTIGGLTAFTGIVTYDNFMISNATNQMNGSTTYNGNTTFAGKLTANEMTINEAFIAKKDAIYQSNMQVSNDLNVIARAFIKKDVEITQGNVTIGKNIVTSGNAIINGNTIINGDLSLNGQLKANDIDVTFGPNSIPQYAVIDRNDFSNDASGLIISKMGLDKTVIPKVTIDLSGATDAIKLPRGTTAERPDLSNNDQGYIRYNAETSQFEGYGAGGAWGSLGGVTDVDQDTFVSAETAAGDDNDELKFFTAGSERMVIDACGNIGIKNSTPTVTLDLSGASDAVKLPIGTTAHRPDTSGNDGLGYIRYNTETSQFEGYGAGNTWGSLGGVTDVDQDTKIVAEVSAGADNDALQFITAGSERLTITSEGDLSLNKSIVLNKKLPVGMSEASFVTVTPTKSNLSANSWSTVTNGVDVAWNVSHSGNVVTASNKVFNAYHLFDASFGNTLDPSTLNTDTSGNFVDASGVVVRDASGNSVDASGNAVAKITELGYITEAATYNPVTGIYEGVLNTPVEIIGDVSGEFIDIASDVSFNISSFHFKAVDYAGFLGAHLLPNKFTFAGYNEINTRYEPIMRVTHTGAPTDNSFNAVTDEYTKLTTTDTSANVSGVGAKPRDVEYYSTSSAVYKKYRLIIEEKSNTTSDYTDVINRSFAGIGEWVITGTSPDPSTIVFTYQDSSANITMNSVDKDTLDIDGNLNVSGVIRVGGKIYLEDTVLSGDISLNDTLIVGGEILVNHGLIVAGDASMNAGLDVSGATVLNSTLVAIDDVSFNKGLSVGGDLSLNGPVALSSTLSVVDDVSFNKGLSVAGDVSLNNKLFINDASGVIVNTSILPETDNTISLGSAEKRFTELHVKEMLIGTDTLNFYSASAGKVVGSLSFDTSKNVLDLSANGKVGESALLYDSKLSLGKYDNSSPVHELDVSGSAGITSTLDVSGATILDSTVKVTGATTLENTVDISGATALASTLDVSGATVLDSTVKVTGSAALASTLDVSGATVLDSTVNVTGAAALASTLDVSGATVLDSTVKVTGAAALASTLDVSGATVLDSTVKVTGAAALASTLDVSGATVLDSTVKVTGAAVLASTLDVSGATVLDSTVKVTGAAALASTLDVSGATVLDDTVKVKGSAALASTLDVSGATVLDGTVNVTEAATLSSSLDVAKATTLSSTLGVSKETTLSSTLDVSGATLLESTLAVTNATTLNSTLDVSDATTVGGTLDVTGATTLTNTLDVTKATTLNSTLDVSDATTVGGTLDVTGDTKINIDKFVVTAESGNTAIDGTLDVAKDTKVNTDKFVITAESGNTAIAGTLDVTGATTLTDTLDVTKATTLNSTLAVSRAATLSSTLDITGATTMSGPLDLDSTADINDTLTLSKDAGVGLVVASEATIEGDLKIKTDKFVVTAESGNTNIAGTLDVAAAAALASTLDVTDATTLSSTLNVTGATVIDGALTISKADGDIGTPALNVASDAQIDGTLRLFSAGTGLEVSGAASINNLTVGNDASMNRLSTLGDATFNGDVFVKGDTSVDGTMTVGGVTTVKGSIVPDEDNVYDLGVGNKRFRSMNVTSTTIGTSTLNFFSPSQGKIVGALSFNEDENVLDLSANGKVGKSALLYNNKLAVGYTDDLGFNDNSSPSVEMDISGDAAISKTLTVGGDVSMNNDVSIEGTLNVKGAVNLTEYNNEYITNIDTTNYTLIVSEDLSLNGRMYVNDDASFNKNVFIKDSVGIGIDEPEVSLHLNKTDAIKLPKGTDGERPIANAAEHKGYIRYNSQTDQFEGFGAGNTWGSLGGVIDVNQDTKITAETTPGDNNDELRFYTAGVERMRVKDNGDVSMNNDLSVQGAVNVDGSMNVQDKIDVTGAAALGSSLTVTGASTLNSTLAVSKATTLSSTLDVSAAAKLASTLDVSGNTVIDGDLKANGTFNTINNLLIVTGNAEVNNNLKVENRLDVKGVAALDSTLDVSGATVLSSTLDVSGATVLDSTVNVTEAATLSSTLDVSKATTLSSTLGVSKETTLSSTLDVTGATTMGSTLDVSKATTLSSTLAVSKETSLSSTLDVSGATVLDSTVSVTEAATLSSTLDVSKATTLSSTLAVSKETSLSSTLDVSGATVLDSTVNVTEAATLSSTLDVSKATTLSSTLAVSKETSLSSTLDVSGATVLESTVNVIGAAALDSTLNVSGATVLDNTVTVTGKTTFDNDVSLNARMDIQGDISLNSSITVTGALTVDGPVKLTEINNEYVTNINTTTYELIVTEDLSLNGQMYVGSDVSFNGGLFVKETSILGGDLSLNSGFSVNGDVSLNAGLNIQGSVELGGDISLNAGISVQSDSSFNGNLNVNGISIGKALNDHDTTTVVGNNAASNLSGVDIDGNAVGIHNTAIGFQSLGANFDKPYNTSVGSEALKIFNGGTSGQNTAVGASALAQTTVGSQNIALGYQAGFDNKSGDQNIFIGNNAGVADENGATSGAVAIGYNAKATKDNQTFIQNDDVYFNVLAGDISGTTAKLHVGMINFLPDGVTGAIPQSAIAGLDGETQTTTGDHIIDGRAFVGIVGSTGTSVINHNLSIKKELTVTENITGSSGMEVEGDASFNSNVSMAGVNNMLSFKTFEPVEVAGAINSDIEYNDVQYTEYTEVTNLPTNTNIQFIKTNTDGQHIMAYSTDASGSIMISNDYGITYSSVPIESLDNSTYEVNRRAAMSLDGRYMVIVGNNIDGTGYIYHSSNFGASFTSALSTSALTYTCATMSGNGQNIFVGTNNEKLYVSTDFGVSIGPHEATPINIAGISGTDVNSQGPNINWRSIITNNNGRYTIAFTDEKVFLSNSNDNNFNNSSEWKELDLSVIGLNTTDRTPADLRYAYMTDDAAYAFLTLNKHLPYRLTQSTHFNYNGTPASWVTGTALHIGVAGPASSRYLIAATTNAGMDGKFVQLVDFASGDTQYRGTVFNTTNGTGTTTYLPDPKDTTGGLSYQALAISGNGAYTYAATDSAVYVKQFNDGTTVQVETGEAFVLSKDMSLNERVFVNGDVIARAGFEVTSDVSLNSNLFVGGDVSMNSSLFVGGDVSMNSKLFVDGDASMNSNLSVAGDASLNSNLFVAGKFAVDKILIEGDASMNAKLFVAGDASMNSILSVGGKLIVDDDASMNSTLSVGGDVSFDSDLHLSGNMGINKQASSDIVLDISASNALRLPKGISDERPVQNDADASYKGIIRYNTTTDQFEGFGAGQAWGSLGGVVDVDGDTYIKAETAAGVDNDQLQFFTDGENRMEITSTGDVSMNQKLILHGDASFNSNLNVNGTLNVTGAVNLTEYNNEYITNIDTTNYTLIVTEDLSLNGNMKVNGTAQIDGEVTLNDNVSIADAKTLTVGTGASSLGGSLTVAGITTLNENVSVAAGKTFTVGDGASSLGGSLTVTGETTLNENVSVAAGKTFTVGDGASSLGGSLTVTGETTLNDNVTVGASTLSLGTSGSPSVFNAYDGDKLSIIVPNTTTSAFGIAANGGDEAIEIDTNLSFLKLKSQLTSVEGAAGLYVNNNADINGNAFIAGTLTLGTDKNEFTISESGDDVTLANTIQDKNVVFTANNGGSQSEFLRLDGSDGEIKVSKDIIPASSTVSLGSEGNPFAEIYVSENSIIFGNAGSSQVSKFAVNPQGQISIQQANIDTGVDVGAPLQYVTQNSFATVSNLTATGTTTLNQTLRVDGDISANANMSLGGDVSFNGAIEIAGDISWNSANIPNDSIPPTAIIGGVGSNHFTEAVIMDSSLFINGDISFNSNLHVGGHMVPRADNAYDIGSADNRIRDLFISESSIYLGEQNKISVSATGDLQFNKIDKTVIPASLQGITDIENKILTYTSKGSIDLVTIAEYLAWAIQSGETVNGKTGDAITANDIYTSDASNFTSVTSADPTSNDLSLNAAFSVGGHALFTSDVSFNSGINIAGDISWNSVNIPDNSIPQTAIIGGVGGNTIDGDLNVKTGFIKQF